MSYKRTYTLDHIHRMICNSEGRQSPTSGKTGHTVTLHADGRTGTTADKRSTTVIILAATIEESRTMDPADGFDVITGSSPGVDSRFTTRLDIVKAVCQGLNSPIGQNKLAEFDTNSSQKRVAFTAPLSPPITNVERFTKSTGNLERGLTASSVFLVVDRLGTSASGEIHIQTAFPKGVS